MELTSYRSLGRSGLIVSPQGLGAMTFGREGWGATEEVSGEVMRAYIEAGGNFIDTAETYADGRSEAVVGNYIAKNSLRDRLVLATKFSWNVEDGNPNAGGNGAKNIHRAVEGSLQRLRTDYIDLYWLHFWDMVTPAEEMLQSMGGLIRAGKIRYFALSDVPAWYATKMSVLAQVHGVPGPIALQMAYSLVERTLEQEHVPAARECGLGITPWGPLGGGFLTGKYCRESSFAGVGRLGGENPLGNSMFTDRNWQVLEALIGVAKEMELSPAKVALAWCMVRPGVTSVLLGASRPEQLRENIAALQVTLTPAQLAALDAASAPGPSFPYSAFNPDVKRRIFGGVDVQAFP